MPASVATAGWMPIANGESSTAAKARGGAWQALGVNATISKALTLRGFKVPTPIQRNTLPSTLSTPPRDVLGMARTGSGKTLAYLIPLIQHLTTAHNPKRGTRALILCPARELAMQILKVGKDLGRSAARGPGKDSQGLTWALIMGGEGLDKQFEALSEQPDIIIATPGRLLHVAVEMNLDFRSLEMVIYDEADRLFEMGFELQLHEIVHRLPASRQNLLFSATLPSAVAEFAKAGLVNPLLIRLDADHKISEDLAMAFFDVKSTMKEAALLAILETNLRVLTNRQETEKSPQAIIFVSTKHHVEYLSHLLVTVGYRVNHIYGSLDQIARQQQLAGFRDGTADLLIVTDVAARGLDIPIMDNVINYDFPTGVRNFIHRVGRTARAGRKGAAWSFVTKEELPYLLELETFLEQPITQNQSGMFFTIPQTAIDQKLESISALEETASDLPSLRQVMRKGQTMFERSRSKASAASHRNSKALRQRVNAKETAPPEHPSYGSVADSEVAQLQSRLLASVQNFTPQETILELGKRGSKGSVDLMSARRRVVAQRDTRPKKALASIESDDEEEPMVTDVKTTRSYRDEHYIDHRQQGAEKNSGYSLKDANFVDQMRSSTLDLVQDEGSAVRAGKASQLKWDRKSKKFGNKNEVGADNKKMIRSESGALLPASYRSGRYDEWRKSKRGQPSDGSKDEPSKPKKHYRHQQLKTELKSPSAILGSRRNLEKRKAKNSRAPRRRK